MRELSRPTAVALAAIVAIAGSSWSGVAAEPVPDSYAESTVATEAEVDPRGATTDAGVDPYDDEDPTMGLPETAIPAPTGDAKVYVTSPAGSKTYFAQPTATGSTWWDGVCTDGESRYTVIKKYPREKIHRRMENDHAKMYCGRNTRSADESKFGIRHIRAKHKEHWDKYSS